MKRFAFILLVFILTRNGSASGDIEYVELKNNTGKQDHVYLVTIIGQSSVKIKEIKSRVKAADSEAANQYYYSAKIIEIINKGDSSSNEKDKWTMLFSRKEKSVLQKIRTYGAEKTGINDTIFIMDGDDLHNSYIYYVKGLHKIFIYYRCFDAAKSIDTGSTCLFISNGRVSKKSGVFYGNIGYGLYPNTSEIRKKIEGILAEKK